MADLDRYRRIHLVGAGGAGMSALGKLLSQQGHLVSGSDLKPGRALSVLTDLGVETWIGHRPDAAARWDLVVSSSAVPAGDSEIMAARSRGVPVWIRPRLLQKLTTQIPTFGVAGTHGKTTSTAMLVAAMRAVGEDPSFVVGGEMVALNTNAHLGADDLLVLEADEAFGTFQHLDMTGLVVTGIESDHLDHYETRGRLEAAFIEVADAVEGPVVACLDDPGGSRLAARCAAVGYGTHPDARWRITDLRHDGTAVAFTLHGPKREVPVTVPKPGTHIALDAAGVLALLAETGRDPAAAAAGLATFAGVKRRFEMRARLGGVTVIDDYAHHPTEVAATIQAAHHGGWDRIWAVFQPHRYSRTAGLAAGFGPALAAADRVVVTGIYGAGEPPRPGVTGRLVADAVKAAGGAVEYVAVRRDVAAYLDANAEAGDLVLLLGAGDITLVADELAARLGQRI